MHPGKVGTYANMAKYMAGEMAIEAVDRAIQTMGGYGFSEEYGVIHYYESARLLRTAPVSVPPVRSPKTSRFSPASVLSQR